MPHFLRISRKSIKTNLLSLWLNRFTTILGTISGKKPRRAWSHKHTPALESDKSSQSQDAIAYDLETRGGERAPDSHMFHWADVQVLIELSTDKRTSTAIKNFRDKGVAMKFYQAIRPFLSLSKFFRDKFVFVVYDHAGCQREELSYDNVKALTRLIAGFSFASDEAIGFDTTMTRKAGQATRIRVNKHILRVIYYIHTSASLNGRCTWIYLVQDEEGTYSVVKDSWVDVSKQHDEAMFLRRCKDLPHVVYLHDSWDVTTSDGVVDSTDRRRDPYEEHCKIKSQLEFILVMDEAFRR
ncbi:hypothetical protein BV25DRAFT_1835516 [Artomyces pyxidatus]|uniref:Uncharacterized protein n=1 Tax=Artomyces pyxidatus TaxID=48021 RepID=A0ACB8TDH1_9AGAM|nr:hypothetical protein BV25DRAFT_1835516 [Artomyces pyxidatus]